MSETVKKSKEQLNQEIREERLIETYKQLKPYLVRLFTHALLLFIALRAYMDFLDSETNYTEFIELLNHKVLVNLTRIDDENGKINCTNHPDLIGKGYEEMESFEFPGIKKSCRCDDEFYPESSCEYIQSINPYSNFKENCAFADQIYVDPKDYDYKNDDNIPEDYKTSEIKPSIEYTGHEGEIEYETDNIYVKGDEELYKQKKEEKNEKCNFQIYVFYLFINIIFNIYF